VIRHNAQSTFMAMFLVGICSYFSSVARSEELSNPDFTEGGAIPSNAPHDWNLGPTGMRGWMFCDKLVTKDARQIAITAVEKGSPADGIIAVGDVLLGVGGKRFSYDPRTEFGRAITAAETEAQRGELIVSRWRAGKVNEVKIVLTVRGAFSSTAPYDCLKSQRILIDGIKQLGKRMRQADYASAIDPIPRSLNALAILASGEKEYGDLVRREATWASDFRSDSFQTWHYGYVMIFLSEYIISTGDETLLPGLRRLAMEAAKGQSAVGSWGHGFALPSGRLGGYGMMNSPGLPLTIGMILARQAGVQDEEVGQAIELSARLIRFYRGKGAIPYGDHAAWTETHEDNGKCGMAAVLFQLLGEKENAVFFTRMAVASHGAERDCGHTGNFFNMLWSLPAIAQVGPQATGLWTQEFGAWYHDLARRWDGSFTHQGPPEPGYDSYYDWDATGAYLLAYALPLKKIILTGKKVSILSPFSASEVESLIADGRGWDNKDRVSAYNRLDDNVLLDRLGSWSPIVRERAADALARRSSPPLKSIIELLDSENLDAQISACMALERLRNAAAEAVPKLQAKLNDDDLWLRVRAASSLAAIGGPAMVALPEMLEMIASDPAPADPRGMEQRFISVAVFGQLLTSTKSLEGVDREKLRSAIAKVLQNQDGFARSEVSRVFQNLSYEEIQPLLASVLQAIEEPAPSGEMFADGVRLNGLKVLASHQIEEGMQASVDYIRTQNPWASEERTPEILDVLVSYGANAQPFIASLRDIAVQFEKGEVNFPKDLSLQKAGAVREAITKIETSKERPKLKRLEQKNESIDKK